MRSDSFVSTVRERADLPSEAAARDAIQARLRVLGHRIAHGEAEAIADELRDEFAGPLLEAGGNAESFSPEAFVDRVAADLGVEASDAERRVRAVFETLGERLNRGEWQDVRAQLPAGYGPLYETVTEEVDT